MSKGARLRGERLNEEVARLREQKEELIQQLAAERMNARNASIILGCLVKRLGEHFPEGIKMDYQIKGWRTAITDEEFVALDGELEVKRNEGACATLLILHKSDREKELDRERSRIHSDRS